MCLREIFYDGKTSSKLNGKKLTKRGEKKQ